MEMNQPYTFDSVYSPRSSQLIMRVIQDESLISEVPPVKPSAGDVFIYLSNGNYGNDWKCDQYRWVNNGSVQLPN